MSDSSASLVRDRRGMQRSADIRGHDLIGCRGQLIKHIYTSRGRVDMQASK